MKRKKQDVKGKQQPPEVTRGAEEQAQALADIPLSFQSPESSLINGADYDPTTETLTLQLLSPALNVKPYVYHKFPADLWREFVQAGSKGRFFQERIRPMFAGKPL